MAKKILMVEDEEIMIDLLQRKIAQEGYEIKVARNGEEGLAVMKEEKPDLVLLDIIMPKMGGFEVMEKMQGDKDLKKIPVIVISNSGQPVEIDRAQKMGAKDWLIKTEFDPQEVIEKIKNKSAKIMPKTILIVEDDKFLRELIAQKLTKEGYPLSEAIDGEEGIKKIKEEKPSLVLLDLILPGIDGFEVLSQMKEDPSVSSIPVIILSNLGQKEDGEKGLKLGAVDYLIKAHFTPGEIIEKIKAVLK